MSLAGLGRVKNVFTQPGSKADIAGCSAHVRSTLKADITGFMSTRPRIGLLASGTEFQTSQSRRDIQTDLALQAEGLQCDRVVGAANQHVDAGRGPPLGAGSLCHNRLDRAKHKEARLARAPWSLLLLR
jgi:hypothetical protein